MNPPHLLIIEDDDLQYEIYEETLGHYRLTRATHCTAALRSLSADLPNLIVLDHVLSDGECSPTSPSSSSPAPSKSASS
jgi:DNA-binding response OmpR family regulator